MASAASSALDAFTSPAAPGIRRIDLHVPAVHCAGCIRKVEGAVRPLDGVVNARVVKPRDAELLRRQAAEGSRFVTLENGALTGGFGSAVREALAAGGREAPVRAYGWPDAFVGQGTTRQLMQDYGLTPDRLTEEIRRWA